jgi:16S rRNA (guanine527-N7)-methyltransferase
MVKGEDFKQLMETICKRNGLELSEEQLRKFEIYYGELLRWNRVHNLTRITDPEGVIKRHFCDSLSLVKFFEDIGYSPSGKDIVDVGSGAGFPGVPLKIYYGEAVNLYLIESVSKKCAFLTNLKRRLGLDYAVLCKMAQEVDKTFSVAVARALEVKGKRQSPLEYADKLLTPLATELIAILKGKEVNGEELKRLGYSVYEVKMPDLKGLKIVYKRVRRD